ncbi:MmgE/PrpD family protein [Halalkalibacter hemicellulosilyticus]|uniref:MmgE/PrpD family protein n=1 Tax=Halalkalibacter hemicellulosilyticusJCM 9152 TaxID=1236971 RepID=W4QJ67_9BACI|nr:MmgE/PrpD family protein [Halalkalibacter hemicellulosilyticus]GAE32136.1 hypothetical protein JCM9152_3655 [Halalkalibacter hemicellulosilyticusJCM 9152]
MNSSDKIAQLVCNTHYDDLPEEIILKVKRAIIDTIGVTLVGSQDPIGHKMRTFVKGESLSPYSSVIGGGFKTSLSAATLANGTMAHILDYDDSGANTQGHPSAPILPVLLSLAEHYHIGGKKIIESYVVGVELFSCLSKAMPMLHMRGWHPTKVLGTLAATVSAAKILDLDYSQVKMAVGIAGSQASGLTMNFGTMTKALHVGNAAQSAITSVMLAKSGFTSSDNIFKNDGGFLEVYSDREEEDLIRNLELWGKPYSIIQPGISVKRYPSCALTHRAIDGVIDMKNSHEFTYQDIGELECRTSPRALHVLKYTKPQTILEAKFSMQYVLSAAVIFGKVGLSEFTEEKLNNSEVIRLMEKVKVRVHNDWEEGDNLREDEVVITLYSGQTIKRKIKFAKGSALSPMSLEDLIDKYVDCASCYLNTDEINSSLELLLDFEKLDSINRLMSIISKTA